MFNTSFFNTLEASPGRDGDRGHRRRARAFAVHAERALRRGGGGRLRRRQRDPGRTSPRTSKVSRVRPSSSQTIRANIVKANIVGRLVAKDFSGAMVWADLIPEDSGKGQGSTTRRSPAVRGDPRQVRERPGHGPHHRLSPRWSATSADGARSVIKFFLSPSPSPGCCCSSIPPRPSWPRLPCWRLISVIWMLGALAPDGLRHRSDEHADAVPDLRDRGQPRRTDDQSLPRRDLLRRPRRRHARTNCARARASTRSPRRAPRSACCWCRVSVALVAGCIGFATILMIPIRIIFELAITATVGVASPSSPT
jgi:hypothetical protein